MNPRIIVLISVVACSLGALAIGVTLWSLPPQFQPEMVYRLKFRDHFPASRPAGDCTLTDCGPRAGIDRYVVDFGHLADASRIDETFLVSDLPAEEFAVGFSVSGGTGAGSLLFEKPNIGTVHLEVTTESGEPIVLERGPLSDWIWSGTLHLDDYAFVYRLSGCFTPAPGESYRIRVRATWEPETPNHYRVRLLAKGGGWQA